jgi:hypothetical protein
MLKTFAALLCVLFFLISCSKSEEKPKPVEKPAAGQELTGTYKGYKFFNKSRKDSLAVTIKIDRLAGKQLNLEEVTPFAHTKVLDMNGMDFVFDRGTGEDDCGRISMKGTGKFSGRNLYVIETITCVRGNAPDKFVEYYVTKI